MRKQMFWKIRLDILYFSNITYTISALRSRHNSRHFLDDTFKCVCLNENVWISITISSKFVPKGPIDNIPALVQIMAWRRSGDESISEPMVLSLLTHICVTLPQWVNTQCVNNTLSPSDLYTCQKTVSETSSTDCLSLLQLQAISLTNPDFLPIMLSSKIFIREYTLKRRL